MFPGIRFFIWLWICSCTLVVYSPTMLKADWGQMSWIDLVFSTTDCKLDWGNRGRQKLSNVLTTLQHHVFHLCCSPYCSNSYLLNRNNMGRHPQGWCLMLATGLSPSLKFSTQGTWATLSAESTRGWYIQVPAKKAECSACTWVHECCRYRK